MASKDPNLLKRLYENVMGTKEQNKAAAESMKRAEENNKAKKAKEEADKKKMAKGGVVKGFKVCATCPSAAKCKAAGKCLKAKMAKGGDVKLKSAPKAAKAGKAKPVLAIMIGVPKGKTKMAVGGMAKKSSGCK
jgi:hypothetical protein